MRDYTTCDLVVGVNVDVIQQEGAIEVGTGLLLSGKALAAPTRDSFDEGRDDRIPITE